MGILGGPTATKLPSLTKKLPDSTRGPFGSAFLSVSGFPAEDRPQLPGIGPPPAGDFLSHRKGSGKEPGLLSGLLPQDQAAARSGDGQNQTLVVTALG